jgi:hypothetical protein
VTFVPRATVVHEYEFVKGAYKWFWLERNRLWSVLANYDTVTLLLLAPLLAATELATLALSFRGGWHREKLRAWRALWRERAELRTWRARVQATRAVADRDLLRLQVSTIDTPLVNVPARPIVNALLKSYGAVARALLGVVRR